MTVELAQVSLRGFSRYVQLGGDPRADQDTLEGLCNPLALEHLRVQS